MLTRRALLAAPLAATAFAGCQKPKFKAGYNILIEIDDSLKSAKGEAPSLEVHVVVLPFVEAKKLEKFPMSEYWNPSRTEGVYAMRKMFFGPGRPLRDTLDADDVLWQRWQMNDVMEKQWIFILADLKGNFQDKDGSQDPRRIILPADPKIWPAHRTIHISIRRDEMINLTPRIQKS
jgi:hypothetical protein